MPAIKWQKSMGGSGFDAFYDIKKTTDGNFVAVGYSGSNDHDVTGNHGLYDGYITKFAPGGNKIWSTLIGGTQLEYLISVVQTADGGYMAVGTTYSHDGDVSDSHVGFADIWVVKITGNGTLQWQKCFGGRFFDQGSCIAPTNDGNYIISASAYSNDGDVSGNHGSQDGWLFKIDPSGNLLWQKCFGGSYYDAFTSVTPTRDNGFIVSGYTNSNDGDVSGLHVRAGAIGIQDYWVVKVDVNGNLQWQKCYGGSNYSGAGEKIVQTPEGGYFIVGNIELKGPVGASGDITTYYDNNGSSDIWGIKTDNTGSIQWQRTLGGSMLDYAYDVINTNDGALLIAAVTSSNDHDVSGGHGGYEYWVTKLNIAGNTQWQLCLGGTLEHAQARVLQNSSDEYVIVGNSTSDNGQITDNLGSSDAWVADISTVYTPSVAIIADAANNTTCRGTPVIFTATPINGGISPTYQWRKNGINVGANNSAYTDNSLANNDIITVVMTSSLVDASPPSATSNAITMLVTTPVTPSVSIAADIAGPICLGTSVTFTATQVNGGSSPTYQWQKNGISVGANNSAYTDNSLVNNDIITVVMTSNLLCTTTPSATGNAITMPVTSPVTPSVSIAADIAGPICLGTSVTFTATLVNGGSSPTYQWRKNGINVGANNPAYTDNSLANNDIITVVMTSNLPCTITASATSNAITMPVNSPVTPSVSIAANIAGPICLGTSVIFTATQVNGGSSPTYQWQKNGINVGDNNSTYTDNSLANNDIITVVMTSNLLCTTTPSATSNAITMPVTSPVTPSVSISSDVGLVINTGTTVTFTATPVNEGSSPTYQWQKNGINVGANSMYTTNTLANNDIITMIMTSNDFCTTTAVAISNALKMKVLPGSNQTLNIPNTFTPNNDGINDTWDINKYLEYCKSCTVQVFNRYGLSVFYSVGYPLPWDGTYNGKNLPEGVYYYMINLKDGNKPFAGWVTIMR